MYLWSYKNCNNIYLQKVDTSSVLVIIYKLNYTYHYIGFI